MLLYSLRCSKLLGRIKKFGLTILFTITFIQKMEKWRSLKNTPGGEVSALWWQKSLIWGFFSHSLPPRLSLLATGVAPVVCSSRVIDIVTWLLLDVKSTKVFRKRQMEAKFVAFLCRNLVTLRWISHFNCAFSRSPALTRREVSWLKDAQAGRIRRFDWPAPPQSGDQ